MVPSGVIETPTDAYKATVLPLNYDGDIGVLLALPLKKLPIEEAIINVDGGS